MTPPGTRNIAGDLGADHVSIVEFHGGLVSPQHKLCSCLFVTLFDSKLYKTTKRFGHRF